MNKVTSIIVLFLFLASTTCVFAQFSFDDLKKWKDKIPGSSEDSKKEDKKGGWFEKAKDLQKSTQKNKKSKSEFTGGEKLSVALAIKELSSTPNPESKKILLYAGDFDKKYTVFKGNEEYAIYRYKNMPPSQATVQFALKKELQKELTQKYKEGNPLETGFYEIIGKKAFPTLTLDDSQVIIIQKVYLQP